MILTFKSLNFWLEWTCVSQCVCAVLFRCWCARFPRASRRLCSRLLAASMSLRSTLWSVHSQTRGQRQVTWSSRCPFPPPASCSRPPATWSAPRCPRSRRRPPRRRASPLSSECRYRTGQWCNVMSVWNLRWHFTNRSVTGTPCNIKVTVCHTAGHYGEDWWLEQWRLQVAAELQQRWRRTNRRQKSVPRSSSSHREGSINQRGASCGR